MIQSVKTFDELDPQYTPEKYLHQIDEHMSSTLGEQLFDLVP